MEITEQQRQVAADLFSEVTAFEVVAMGRLHEAGSSYWDVISPLKVAFEPVLDILRWQMSQPELTFEEWQAGMQRAEAEVRAELAAASDEP